MHLSSPSFADGAPLPFASGYESENRSPALAWTDVPVGTVSLALICMDQNGPGGVPWIHWLVWNIPPTETRLLEGIPPYYEFENGMKQGQNGYRETGWGGPCPPEGEHRYDFTLYALDILVRPMGRNLLAVKEALRSHFLDSAAISATFAPGHSIVSYQAIREGKQAFSGQ